MRFENYAILAIFLTLASTVAAGQKDSAFPCEQCHNDKMNTGSSHFIKSGEDCLFCHSSEIAEISYASHKVITHDQDDACLGCHISSGNMITKTGHESVRCVECHSPHGSQNEHMLISSSLSLCSESCHTDSQLGRSHPVGEGVTDANTGTSMTCISTCHSIHRPKDENSLLQLAAMDLYRSCHRGKF